jgi:xanthine dehydrogenase YagR molybdenum-binding subunit
MGPHIGTPTSRVDGIAKVTGAAKYAGEFALPGLCYAAVVTSAIPKGRLAKIDTSEAALVQSVLTILTHENRPPMAGGSTPGNGPDPYSDEVAPPGTAFRPLFNNKVLFDRQPIAVVVAEDWETAEFAASLVKVDYQREPFATDLFHERSNAFELTAESHSLSVAKPRGDAAKGLASSPVRHEAEYFVPMEHHNPIELFASTASVDGGKITIYDKTQGVQNVQHYLCGVFEMKPEDVRVCSPFVGGAFGSGLRPQYEAVLAVLAAMAVKRPVRVVLTRAQLYGLGYRPGTIEHLALGAKKDGSLETTTQEAIAMTSQFEAFARNDTTWAGLLYKSPNAKFTHRLVRLDVSTPCDMRAPGAASGVYALECAMDELAVALNMDPVELRLHNYSDLNQNDGLPYTSKALRECYREGAKAFGWEKRNPQPRSMRDGTELVGWGMATGVWEALQVKVAARVSLSANLHAEVVCGTSDIGTGTYTLMAQVAADALGLPLESISVKLGDSDLPQSPVEGGSWIATSVAHAIVNAAETLRAKCLDLANKMPHAPLSGLNADDVALLNGQIVSRRDDSKAVSLSEVMRRNGLDRIEAEEESNFEEDDKHAHNTHSAVFAEVKVDEQLHVIRVTRVVNAVAAGRIINPKTAASQIAGGVVWGIGMALHEETVMDHRFGRIMNANFADYHVPVNADVHDIKVIFVDEPDALINPLGMKGVGEIGIVGVAAAIANAVYHATGKRVRDLPITIDKV